MRRDAVNEKLKTRRLFFVIEIEIIFNIRTHACAD